VTAELLPEELAKKWRDVFGAEGSAFVERFPETLARYLERWDLTLEEPYSYIGYAWVRRARLSDGSPAVLKIAPPDKEFAAEVEALRIYDGRGIARLLDGDAEGVALLLERLEPGTTLAELDDDVAATAIAGSLMRELHRPLPAEHAFPTIERWGQAFARVRERNGGGCGSFPPELFEPAERLFAELCASAGPPVLLHGDLHHWNILQATRDPWLAIDPKGVAGEAAYETGALLRNKLEALEDRRAVSLRRIAQLSEVTGYDRERILGWGFAQGVLSALWMFEDHGTFDERHLRLPRALLGEI